MKAAAAVRKAIRSRGKGPGNITFFYGAKVDRDWVLPSDLELSRAVYADCHPDITTYDCDPERISVELSKDHFEGTKPDQIYQRYRGQRGLVEVKSSMDAENDPRAARQKLLQSTHATAIGCSWEWWTEEDAVKHRTMLMNWLSVSAVLSEFRYAETGFLEEAIRKIVDERRVCSLGDIRQQLVSAWHLPFVTIMRLHTQRQVIVELADHPIDWRTKVSAVTS